MRPIIAIKLWSSSNIPTDTFCNTGEKKKNEEIVFSDKNSFYENIMYYVTINYVSISIHFLRLYSLIDSGTTDAIDWEIQGS